MSRLDLARTRFEAALAAVENAALPLAASRGEASKTSDRLVALSAEREALQARVAELEDEIQALSSITEEVEERLDGAIGDIRAALGH
jgi:predicted  nucleic acid-binding Zn-ribbon protein